MGVKTTPARVRRAGQDLGAQLAAWRKLLDITVNVQGLTGKKKDFTRLPYAKIQAFSVETAGTLDLDAELDLWFSGLGDVRLEFKGHADIRQLGQLIAQHVL